MSLDDEISGILDSLLAHGMPIPGSVTPDSSLSATSWSTADAAALWSGTQPSPRQSVTVSSSMKCTL
jgi:hypothetical protein